MQKEFPDLNIAVLSRPSGVSKRVLLGVAAYIRKKNKWAMSPYDLEDEYFYQDIPKLCDGAIIVDEDVLPSNVIEGISEQVPTVLVGSSHINPNIPHLKMDEKEISKIAAQTFIDRGFEILAFAGATAHSNTRKRYQYFNEVLEKENRTPFVFSTNYHLGSKKSIISGEEGPTRKRLNDWISSVPKPIGIFASDDNIAFEIYQSVNRLGFEIPNDIALLGVNDDGFICKITNPSLSSIRLPYERVGYDAADKLLKLIKNKDRAKGLEQIYPPIGLIARDSIKSVVVRDSVVRDAIIYIQENYMHPINVEDILSELNVSRSLLERRFRDEMGITPLVELRRQRIEKARALLSDTNEPIHDMGKKCGFSSAIRFTTVFKEQVGMTPSEFRKKMYPVIQS